MTELYQKSPGPGEIFLSTLAPLKNEKLADLKIFIKD
jgi:hypothetical protein